MRTTFVDTVFYVAFVSRRDALHTAAIATSNKIRGRLLTTEYVLLEVGNWFCEASCKLLFLSLLGDLRRDPRTTILPASQDLFDAGVSLYSQRRDKNWSLTDCISFAVMQQHGLTDALTADRHFEQAGFSLLLKSPSP